jgi:hypothetical protein
VVASISFIVRNFGNHLSGGISSRGLRIFTKETGNEVLYFFILARGSAQNGCLLLILIGLDFCFWSYQTVDVEDQPELKQTLKSHRILGVLFSLPLIITAVTEDRLSCGQ